MGDHQQRLIAVLNKAKPYLLMILMQFGTAGMFIISMSTFNHGMSRYVFIVYRNAFAAAVLAPFAFLLERNVRPKMTFPIFWRIMLLALVEIVIDHNFVFLGMVFTSASYTAAITNSVPSITFLMAFILRLEKVRMKERRSQAKVLGTLITFGGAVFMALYKGPAINIFGNSSFHKSQSNSTNTSSQRWILGTLFLLIACVAFATFYILQSKVLKLYPAEMSLSTLICFAGTLQMLGLAFAIEHHPEAWSIGWNSRLLGPLYSGVVTTGILYYVQGLVMKTRGPVFVTAFNPLRMVIVAVMAVFILGEKLHLGSIIGSIFVVLGLYAVIWGKSKDHIVPKSTTLKEAETENELPIRQPSPSTMDAKTELQPQASSLFTDIEAMSPQQKPMSANEPQTKITTENVK